MLVIDNYDSFVFNLVQYLHQLNADCEVRRNDELASLDDTEAFDGVLLSPGPGVPEAAGCCVELVRRCAGRTPVFGVCLGLQAIAVAYDGTVTRAPELLHGKTSRISHTGIGVFAGLANPFVATRYHSLAVEPATVPAEFEVTAWSESGVLMGMRHRTLALEGVQFHPESVLTDSGHRMLANWLASCGDAGAVARSAGLGPRNTTL